MSARQPWFKARVVRDAKQLERELRLALMRAQSAEGSAHGKVWRLNAGPMSNAARALRATCDRAMHRRASSRLGSSA